MYMLFGRLKRMEEKRENQEQNIEVYFFLMIRRPQRSTLSSSSAASDVYRDRASTMTILRIILAARGQC